MHVFIYRAIVLRKPGTLEADLFVAFRFAAIRFIRSASPTMLDRISRSLVVAIFLRVKCILLPSLSISRFYTVYDSRAEI